MFRHGRFTTCDDGFSAGHPLPSIMEKRRLGGRGPGFKPRRDKDVEACVGGLVSKAQELV